MRRFFLWHAAFRCRDFRRPTKRRAIEADSNDQSYESFRNEAFSLHPSASSGPRLQGAALNASQIARIAVRLCEIVVALASTAATALAAEADIRIVRHGREVATLAGNRIAEKLRTVVESSTVHSTTPDDPEAAWIRAVGSGSFVHVVFAAPRTAKLNGYPNGQPKAIVIHEILLPLPEDSWPAHVFARTEGNTIQAFTKYDPLALRDLVAEPDLRLRSIRPYSQLLALPAR